MVVGGIKTDNLTPYQMILICPELDCNIRFTTARRPMRKLMTTLWTEDEINRLLVFVKSGDTPLRAARP